MNNTKKALALAALVLVALAGYKVMNRPDAAVATPDPTQNPMTAVGATRTVSTKLTYQEPSGTSTAAVKLFLDPEGTIMNATVAVLAVNDVSKNLQTAFAAELPVALKGKKLAELTAIDRVGGASLTTKAFNDALAALKEQK